MTTNDHATTLKSRGVPSYLQRERPLDDPSELLSRFVVEGANLKSTPQGKAARLVGCRHRRPVRWPCAVHRFRTERTEVQTDGIVHTHGGHQGQRTRSRQRLPLGDCNVGSRARTWSTTAMYQARAGTSCSC